MSLAFLNGRDFDQYPRQGSKKTSIATSRFPSLAIMGADILAFSVAYELIRAPFMAGNFFLFHADPSGRITGVQGSIDWFIVFSAVLTVSFALKGHYARRQPFWDDLRTVLGLFSVAALADAALFQFSTVTTYHIRIIAFWVGMAGGLVAFRQAIRAILSVAGLWKIPTILVGSGENAEQTFRAIYGDQSLGFEIQYAVCMEEDSVSDSYAACLNNRAVPLERLPADSLPALAGQGFHLIIAPEEEELEILRMAVDSLSLTPNSFDIVPPLRGIPLYGLDVNYKFGSEVLILRPRNNLSRWTPRTMKRASDFLLAVILLVALSPLMALIAWLIHRTGSNPIFRHERVGRHGKTFNCLKFQTMVPNAKEVLEELLANDPEALKEWENGFKLRNDPRVTKIGNFLRKTSLDELPQIFNVVRGEMSLTGPRPITKKELVYYGDYLPYYYEVPPGITGLWQISGRNDVDYARRVYLDTWYVKNWSLWYDFVILVKTVTVVLCRSGAY